MYELHRVFCALPAGMQEERRAFYDVVGDVNTEQGTKRGVLFVPVAASSALRAVVPADVRSNIRACRYYIEVLPEGAPAPESDPQLDYTFALECRADSSLPMKEVVALPRAAFSDLTEFRQRIREFLSRWLAEIPAQSASA